jgi:hypothetical protein
METSAGIQALVQAGAVGLCFYLIYVNRKINNGRMDQMLQIMKDNTDALVKNAEVMGKFSEKLDELIRRK